MPYSAVPSVQALVSRLLSDKHHIARMSMIQKSGSKIPVTHKAKLAATSRATMSTTPSKAAALSAPTSNSKFADKFNALHSNLFSKQVRVRVVCI